MSTNMKPILASLITASPLLAALAYVWFIALEPNLALTGAEASGGIVLTVLLIFLTLLVFVINPIIKRFLEMLGKSSLALFTLIIFLLSSLIGATTPLVINGSMAHIDAYLLSVAALMGALPAVALSSIWWWLTSTRITRHSTGRGKQRRAG